MVMKGVFIVQIYSVVGKTHLMDIKLDDVLTIEELATYMMIPRLILYKLVREGKIPSQKIGRYWRFRKGAIDHWLGETRTNEPSPKGDR